MTASDIIVKVPRLGLYIPLTVVVPKGPDLLRRTMTCAHITAAALMRGRRAG